MSRGYPSMERARKAYWRGAASAARKQAVAGAAGAPNPYRNEKLADLWARGRARAQAEPTLQIPAKFGERHTDKQRPRPGGGRGPGGSSSSPSSSRGRFPRREPRDFDRGGGRGGW